MTPVLVAGSGKMARNLGLHLLERGIDVCWISRDAARLAGLEASMGRRARRLPGAASFRLPEDAPAARVLVESVEESLDAKRALLATLAPRVRDLVLTNSSSLLPSELHSRAAGLHFFYPVGETALAEAILPPGYADRPGIEAFAAAAGVRLLVEDERSAFVVTRILLPLQAAALRDLVAGVSPGQVDAASESALSPIGVLTLMDAIGLDVLAPATARFASRMTPGAARAAEPLVDGLATLVALGKQGRKNRDGLLCGAPLPWLVTGAVPTEGLGGLVAAACVEAIARGLIAPGELDRVLAEVWGATCTLDAWLAGHAAPAGELPL